MKVRAYVTGDYFEGHEEIFGEFLHFAEEKNWASGDVLVDQGERFPGFYLLTSGVLEVSCVNDEGRRKVLNLFTPRILLGVSSVERIPSRVSYTCLTPVRAGFLPRESFARWSREMLLYFAQIQTFKSQSLLKQIEYSRYYSAEERALRILEEYEAFLTESEYGTAGSGLKKENGMKKQLLSDLLGVTNVHLSHIIAKLEKNGSIQTTRSEVFRKGGCHEEVL